MRVALICPYDLTIPGGVRSHVLHLAEELRRGGDEVVAVAPGPPAGEHHISAGRSFPVPFNRSVAPVGVSPTGTRWALRELRRFRPDVVHVHEPASPLLSLAASLSAPPPLVGTFHAWSDRSALYRAGRPLVRRACARLTVRVAVSQAAAEFHAGALGLPVGAFRVIPNGVDADRFGSAEPMEELASDTSTVLFVGRLEPRKGVEQLIRAFVRVKARRPGVRLLVVGDGPERDRCQALLPARLRSSVAFLGSVAQDDLPRFYASADVVAAPALGGESFGIVLLEAMAAGRPVVATTIPGYAGVVTDGVEGRLVPPGDHVQLADALEALLDNERLRAAMGAQGRRAARRFDWSAVTDRIRAAYRDAVGG